MKVKLEWINELVDLSGLTVKEIVDTLGLYSIEVEGVEKVVEGTNLVIGHVESKVPHPDSDHLNICMVNIGNEVTQIVCGAPNVEAGQNVIVALCGAELPGGFKIKKSKIRGVESNGMICSLGELGMEKKFVEEEYASGIYYFTDEVVIGSNPLEKLNLHDEVIELGLTPNRGDLLSMLGVAYEMSAVFNRPMKELAYSFDSIEEKTTDSVNVKLETEKCLVYYAKKFKDIEIKSSPQWLKSRLIAFGVRPINNVVDITNYIMALFGQPLHAFDADKLGNNILVRNAYEGEEIVTLDNVERTLANTDIVITDGEKPVALAGVMGGLSTCIDDNTKNMVLEAAVFDPKSIRITSTKLDLRSESSSRYEKGVDIARCKWALEYTSYLLQTLANAKVCDGEAVCGKTEVELKEVTVTSDYISKYLGVNISQEEIVEIIKKLKFDVKCNGEDIIITVPSRRLDVSIKADIVEEVGRLYGYEKLPVTLPKTSHSGKLNNYQLRRKSLKHAFVGLGLTENVTYSLDADNLDFTFMHKEDTKEIELMYPISAERKVLRRSLSKSSIEHAMYCFNRKIKNIATFEIGKVYYEENGKYEEEENLVVLGSGVLANTTWKGENEVIDFYVLKGLLDVAFKEINVEFTYKPLDREFKEMHPTRTAIIMFNNKEVGYIGEIHPKYAKEHDLKDVYVAEIKIKDILENMEYYNNLFKNQIRYFQEFFTCITDILKTYSTNTSIKTHTNVTDLLENNEYKDIDSAKKFLTLVKDEKEISKIITKIEDTSNNEIVYSIGEEGKDEYDDYSIIKANYSLKNGVVASIGVVGPKRLDYYRIASALKYITEEIAQLDNKEQGE